MNEKLQQSTVPVPDPTKLTTDAVDKAKVELKELFDTKLNGFRDLLTEKFAKVDEKFIGRDTALKAALDSSKELVKQQNDSNTIAIDKAALSTKEQFNSQAQRIDDLKEIITKLESRNWSVVGAYIVGAIGIAALVAAVLIRH